LPEFILPPPHPSVKESYPRVDDPYDQIIWVRRLPPPGMSRLIAVAVLLVCVEHGASFSVQLGLPAAASGQLGNIRNMRARALRSMGRTQFVMQRAEESWNVGRFAKTFGFFNGNPLLRLLPFLPSGEPSVRQPKPLSLSRNELLLWNFEGMEQVS
jgi:hypothetical protein